MISSAIDIFKPVMEMAVYSAARYANACNRNTVTAIDMEYGMKYATMNFVGKHVGSYFPDEVYDEDDEESEDDEDDEFTRYEGTDETILAINAAYDAWDSWVPEIPAEILIKRAIDEKAKTM